VVAGVVVYVAAAGVLRTEMLSLLWGGARRTESSEGG